MASKEQENGENNELLDEIALEQMLDDTAAPNTEEESQENLHNDPRSSLPNLGVSKLRGYDIEEDVRKAVESGDIDAYCQDLAKRLEEKALGQCARIVSRCESVTKYTLTLLEEKQMKAKLGKKEMESLKAKINSLPVPVKSFVNEMRSYAENKKLSDAIKMIMKEDMKAFRENTAEEARSIAHMVLNAANEFCDGKHQERESDLISIATSDEVAAANDEEDKHEGNETVENESDEKSEMAPITEQEEDQCVIPTPPPPPPIYSSFRDVNMNFTREDVNQIKRELNFAISRLTSEVVTSYEQARAMQKHVPPSLNQIFVDFTQNQEIKKTFFIKEIITCVERVLNKLTPKDKVHGLDNDLQDLNETVKLLHTLQTSKKYEVHGVAVTRTAPDTIGLLFYVLLIISLSLIVLLLSFTGERFALIVFIAVVFVFMLKSWQALFSAGKKRVEVFGRVKKSEKVD